MASRQACGAVFDCPRVGPPQAGRLCARLADKGHGDKRRVHAPEVHFDFRFGCRSYYDATRGGAITVEEITNELTLMREAELGGVELQPDLANQWNHKVPHSPHWDRKTVAIIYGARWCEPTAAAAPDLPPSGLLRPVLMYPIRCWTVTF